jgi:hypothetical protein
MGYSNWNIYFLTGVVLLHSSKRKKSENLTVNFENFLPMCYNYPNGLSRLELADNEQSGSKADTAISYPGTGGR